MTAPAYTQTTPPAAPSVTAGAEFKGLRFDWESVAGTSWYQFEYRPNQSGPWFQQGRTLPASSTSLRFRLPLHLFNWTYARYRVAACNAAGCTRSSEVSVSDLRRDAVGYFKASQSLPDSRFGADSDISPDGLNFVVAAPGDYQYGANGYVFTSGAAYVFRRAADGTWTERARLLPTIPPFNPGANDTRVGISADGNTVVVGAPNYKHSETDAQVGEVFVFHFDGAHWIRTRILSGDRGLFGRWVEINDAGDTIAAPYGVPESTQPRRVAIYKLIDGTWRPVRALADRPSYPERCGEGVMSRDGTTIAETCHAQPPGAPAAITYVRVHSGPNWTLREDIPLKMSAPSALGYGHTGIAIDATGKAIAAQIHVLPEPHLDTGPAEVQLFSKESGAWSKVSTLTRGAWRDDFNVSWFGSSLELSGDGVTLAIGDPGDNGYGTGPRAAPLNPDPQYRSGGYYIYRYTDLWKLTNVVKPNLAAPFTQTFGRSASLNGNGQTLLIGDSREDGDSAGIGGNWNLISDFNADSGAVFLY
jgi:hypothetical protein